MWWEQLIQKDLNRQTKAKTDGVAPIKSSDLPVDDIARMFKDMKIFQDISNSKKFIWGLLNCKKERFDYNDFLCLFVKCILKDIVCGIADTV